MADNSTIFSGSSRYSSDFSQIIDRSVRIASLPLTQLQNERTTLASRQTAWATVQTKFTSLKASLGSITSSSGSAGFTASSTDLAVAQGTAAAGVLEGSYSVKVIDIGSHTTALGNAGVTDPAAATLADTDSFSLTANGKTITVEPGARTLSALVSAINGKSDAGVRATLVNVASAGSPADYRLSLQSNEFNNQPIHLTYTDSGGGSNELLGSSATGSEVTYRINGFPAESDPPITSDSRSLTVAPGLTINVLKAGSAEINVGRDQNSLANAISGFVSAFNASVDEVDKHRGKSAGVLAGESSITTLNKTLRNIMQYSSADSTRKIQDFGLTFGQDGKLQFDTSAVSSMSSSEAAAMASFLGAPTTGGFLKHVTDALSSLDNSTNGILSNEVKQAEAQITAQDKRITEGQLRVDEIEKGLVAKMSAADAAIALMEQQVSYFTGMFEAMRANSE